MKDPKKSEASTERLERDPCDFYHTEAGYLVFTEQYHLKRGYCCQSGCRHCPFGYNATTKAVEKPQAD
ncbi:MAG: hypothetical protein IPK99_15625 [Flavobacteriales bacterium]|nr:hypothetical protein [Flavobacteriales bacterium]